MVVEDGNNIVNALNITEYRLNVEDGKYYVVYILPQFKKTLVLI